MLGVFFNESRVYNNFLCFMSSKARRRRRNFQPQIPTPTNCPPAPLPGTQPDQPNAEVIYPEPEPEPPRRGSVDSLEWRSNDRRPNISSKQSQRPSPSEGVIPRPPSISDDISILERLQGNTQPQQETPELDGYVIPPELLPVYVEFV